jgi:hypothetical protein
MRSLIFVLVFGAGFVGGTQFPSYSLQYQQRVTARFDQAATDLTPFQAIADRHHGGSMARLIQHHLRSSDPTFYEEGMAIQAMVDNYDRLQESVAGLDGSLLGQLGYLITDADRELAAQTWAGYRPTLVTETNTFVFAAIVGAGLCVFAWLISLFAATLLRRAIP